MSVHFFDNVKSDRTIFAFLWKDKFLPLLKLIADRKLKTIVTYNYPGSSFDLLGLLLGNIVYTRMADIHGLVGIEI